MARWNFCNILHVAPDAKRLWQLDAKGKGFVVAREHRVPHAERLPSKLVGKSWSNLWQPRINVAWLPAETVFLRVVELPAANIEETTSMVELQLEKLSPMPVTQIVWTMHVLGTHQSAAKADGTVESLQAVVVVIASRTVVEEFLGRLERDGFMADRLEVPMLDQLEAVQPTGDSVWMFPLTFGGQNAALAAWWVGGAWRSLSFITLQPAGNRAEELQGQLGLLAMAGEVEGWFAEKPAWHLVADPVTGTEWEQLLRAALNEPVKVTAPPPLAELAGRSATRASAAVCPANLQPAEYSERYREQFYDRLWLHLLGFLGVVYSIYVVIYLGAAQWEGHRASDMEGKVMAISNDYTNAIQLKARLDVLEQRAQLKFAALDTWKWVAEEMPESITLQRFGFVDGQKVTLSGTVPDSQISSLFDFDSNLRKKLVNGKPVFDPLQGDRPNPHGGNGQLSWSMSVVLLNSEADSQ